ncbi:hypothetical protein [Pseudomonas sp. 9AZ]|uniref:hypothetical protein n=1 Tax=Pseudomonas sp. 9AZ TaxID=2653168 RepID=UPI00135916CE|nr:hypothetical protein [Pseudomonas sp. 9AZ]
MSNRRKPFLAEPFKSGPFKLSKFNEDWATYLKHLAIQLEGFEKLPNFEEDSSIYIFSDYSGDHKGARFSTYSFLLMSGDKSSVFEKESMLFRESHSLGEKEISYKDISFGPLKRSIKDYLKIADQYIHGLILTVCIDNNIKSVFAADKTGAKNNLLQLSKQIDSGGDWSHQKLERMYRIYCIIVLLLDLTTTNAHKILWQSDTDKINEEGKKGNFSQSQQHFIRFLSEFTDKSYPLFGFAKTFEKPGHFTDLLSLADLAAGMTQDLLSYQYFNDEILVEDEKAEICRWLGRESKFLKKSCISITKIDGDIKFDSVKIEQIG